MAHVSMYERGNGKILLLATYFYLDEHLGNVDGGSGEQWESNHWQR